MAVAVFFIAGGVHFGRRSGGIAAHGAAVLKHPVRAGIIADWTADRGKITAAVGAGLYVAADFVTAIIAKKTWFLLHLFIIGIFL
jgi:hypothetical protein